MSNMPTDWIYYWASRKTNPDRFRQTVRILGRSHHLVHVEFEDGTKVTSSSFHVKRIPKGGFS